MSQPDKKIRVGISVGEITGIGIEVILKTFEDPRMLEFCTPIVFGSAKTLSFQRKHLRLATDFMGIDAISHAVDGKMNVLSIWKEHPDMEFGKPTQDSGALAIQSLKAATDALKNDVVDVLVTAPISKHNIQSENFSFPGHTNYLASVFKGESIMFMIADSLRIALLTDHIAIKEVADAITPELIERKLQYVYHSLIEDFQVIRPKIAFLGINPHSGDQGVIGQEDEKVMKPAIKKMFDSGKLVFGPYPADSFFGSENYKKFDAVVAAYHDQGLIPFKTLAFGRGVNYTAGLRKIRTSPDHGTAFEIAGTGEASAASFQEAVFLALEIFKNRERYRAYKANPLSFSRERESDKKSD